MADVTDIVIGVDSEGNSYGWGSIPATTTNATDGSYWVYMEPIPFYEPVVVASPRFAPPQRERKEPKMRGLFQVYVVDPESDVIVGSAEVVAKSTETAKFKAIQSLGSFATKDIDDYDIIAHRLGDVRAKKEVQEVRVVTNVVNAFEETKRA